MHPDNLGPQFKDHILLHRGIRHVGPEVAKGELGIHWSHDIDVARHFANPDEFHGVSMEPEDNQGVVVSALVHKDHIIKPNTDEWWDAQGWGNSMNNTIYEPDHWEEEATVRPGSPVHITALQHDYAPDADSDFKSRRMRYTKPRKSQA